MFRMSEDVKEVIVAEEAFLYVSKHLFCRDAQYLYVHTHGYGRNKTHLFCKVVT